MYSSVQNKIYFQDQEDAGKQLLDHLPVRLMQKEQWIMVALSNNSLTLLTTMNKTLKLKYDRLFIEPIFAPSNDECEIAMVSEADDIVIHEKLIDSFNIQKDYIYGEAHRRHEDNILSDVYHMRKGESFVDVKDKHILLVDLGTETGLSVMTSIKTILNLGAKNVSIAFPVISKDIYDELLVISDNVYSLHVLENYITAYFYYNKVENVGIDKVAKILESRNKKYGK